MDQVSAWVRPMMAKRSLPEIQSMAATAARISRMIRETCVAGKVGQDLRQGAEAYSVDTAPAAAVIFLDSVRGLALPARRLWPRLDRVEAFHRERERLSL